MVQLILNRLLLADLSRGPVPADGVWPFVSVVVPARNEERGIRAAVTSFCTLDYPSFEVIVVDDGSTDGTAAILADLQAEHERLQVVTGVEPPPGWLGKPHALEQGRGRARGDWMLFVDADVVYAPDLLRRAMAYAQVHELGMLTLCPRVTTGGVIEAVLMSSVYLFAFAATPMFLANRRRFGWVAAGVGSFNLVRREALEACGAFASLPDSIIDDVMLGRKVKGAGYALHLGLAGPLIRVRMYESARAAVAGFAKNTFPAMRRRPWTIAVPFVLGMLVTVLPYYGFLRGLTLGTLNLPAAISLAAMHLVLGGLAVWFRQPWPVAVLNPIREFGWWWIVLRSMVLYYRRGLVWRGRNYGPISSPRAPSNRSAS
ncbi:MAG: glycosyltransferase [Planctomycetes bacterium]|nr:glycosyltransferase [Planctomycetota bacterium]